MCVEVEVDKPGSRQRPFELVAPLVDAHDENANGRFLKFRDVAPVQQAVEPALGGVILGRGYGAKVKISELGQPIKPMCP